MEPNPASDRSENVAFSIADFMRAGEGELKLELLAGAGSTDRTIEEPIINRPGLAITGFYEHFAWRRVQLIGLAEMAYLDSLSREERVKRLQALVDRRAYLFVFTNGQKPSAEAIAFAEKSRVVFLSTPLETRAFANRAAFVLERLGAPCTTIYGTMIEVSGIGVLFEGDPGLGKSETALGLIKRGHALIADDLTCIRRDVGTGGLFASASETTAGYMEIRGIGIMHIPSIFGVNAIRGEKRLQLVITFRNLKDIRGEIDRIGQTRRTKRILGVDVPNVVLPVSEGRDLVNLVETAAQQHKLMLAGYDPVKVLSERLHCRADAAVAKGVKKRGKRNGRR